MNRPVALYTLAAVKLVCLLLLTTIFPAFDLVAAQGDPSVQVRIEANLNLRAAASVDSIRMGTIPAGTELAATAISPDREWAVVNYNAQEGWIALAYVTVLSGSLADLPISEQVFGAASPVDQQTTPTPQTLTPITPDNVIDLRELAALTENFTGNEIFLSPNGRALAMPVSNADYTQNTLLVYDVSAPVHPLQIPVEGFIFDVAFSLDDTQIAVATGTAIRLFDVMTGELLATLAFEDSGLTFAGIAFSPNGTHLAIAYGRSAEGTILVWNPATDEQRVLLEGPLNGMVVYPATDIAFSPDGTWLAAATRHRTYVLDLATGDLVAELANFTSPGQIMFSSDGAWLATGSVVSAGMILWATASWETVVRTGNYLGHNDGMAFSPDGSRLALVVYSGEERTPQIWDTATGDVLLALEHPGAVSVALSPDGSLLASAAYDGTLRLWDAATGEYLAEIQAHGSPVFGALFSSDGMVLTTQERDDVVRLWGVPLSE